MLRSRQRLNAIAVKLEKGVELPLPVIGFWTGSEI
jgi:hypothetical protein